MDKLKSTYTKKGFLQASDSATCIPWRLLFVLSLLNLIVLLGVFTQPFSPTIGTYVYGLIAIVYPLSLVFICIKDPAINLRSFNVPFIYAGLRRRFIPLLLGLDISFIAAAQVAFFLYFVITHADAPFPSLPYELMFGGYPCLILAVLFLPVRGISLLARLRIFLDSLIIIVAVATLCAYLVFAPILLPKSGLEVEKIAGMLFPSADLILLFCLLLVALRSGESQLRPVLIMLGLAFSIIFLIHADRLFEALNHTLHWVSPVTSAWIPAMALLTGAAQTLKNIHKKDEETQYAALESAKVLDVPFPTSHWKSLLPLLLIVGVSLLSFLLWLVGIKKLFQGQIAIIYIGGFIVLMLVVLRQLLALYEIGILQGKLQKRNRSLSFLNDLLAKQATIDSLTGLPNHRELVMRLDEALEHAKQTASTCAILFIDFDYFKAINDCSGHLVGDAVLCEFSELVTTNLCVRADLLHYLQKDRKAGAKPNESGEFVLGRWGGEEFVAILPGVEPDGALQIAERIRVLVEQHAFAGEQEVHLTCSFGTATYPYVATQREDLLMRADRAMYAAKRLGRNQTRMAIDPLVLAMGMLGETPEISEETEILMVVEALIAALEARDRPTGQHSRRVAALSLKLALALGLTWSDACIIGMGGLLHDLGKVAMPDTILFKRGKLNATELEYMGRHPLIGEEILAPLPSLHAVAEIVRTHHEWLNGSGYPDGLRGENIPLGARVVAVADAYDAIISHRIYREGRASSEAANELSKGAGKQFDPQVVGALDRLLAVTSRLSAASTSTA